MCHLFSPDPNHSVITIPDGYISAGSKGLLFKHHQNRVNRNTAFRTCAREGGMLLLPNSEENWQIGYSLTGGKVFFDILSLCKYDFQRYVVDIYGTSSSTSSTVGNHERNRRKNCYIVIFSGMHGFLL